MRKISIFSKWIKEKYNSASPLKLEWGIVGLISIGILCLFFHGDSENLIKWSINMLDVTFQGKPLDFYKYSIENPNNAPDKYVSGTLYSLMLWAIWNIPIWIIKKICGVKVLANPIVYIWAKMFLVFCLGITMFFVYRITEKMTDDISRAKWAMFLLASSVFIYIGVYYGGQNDIVICSFATAAVFFLMEGKNKWFYFLAGMAISVKYFFFIPYIAIILLLEKKIIKIIGKITVGIFPTIIYWIITRLCPMVNESATQGSPIEVLLKEMIGGAFPVIYSNLFSLFISMLLLMYLLAYLTIPINDEERNKYIIYFVVASSSSMLLFSTFQYYRVVMLCPFMAIMLVNEKEKLRINIILETIFSITLFGLLILQSGRYLFVSSVVRPEVVELFFNKNVNGRFFSLGIDIFSSFSNDAWNILLQVLATVIVVSCICLLIINNPRMKLTFIDIPQIRIERWIYWLRTIVVIVPVVYVVYGLLI